MNILSRNNSLPIWKYLMIFVVVVTCSCTGIFAAEEDIVFDNAPAVEDSSDITFENEEGDSGREIITTNEDIMSGNVEKWQEGMIYHNGSKYQYNFNLHVYLLMGIDQVEPVHEAEDFQSGGQADAIYLLIADPEKEELSVLPINRNTMTDVYTCDKEGNYLGTGKAQICVQHGFGDGKRLSCVRTVDAVSNLLYQVPINGYFSMNVGAVPAVNDAIGGVTVEVLNNMDNDKLNVHLVEGETKNLTGTEAYVYLRNRNIDDFASADLRLERQRQYISAYINKISQMEDRVAVIKNLYKSIDDYMVTNLKFGTVIEELANYSFDDSRMYTIPGKTIQGEVFEEFYVDEDGLYDLILQIFYKKVEE